MSEAKKDEVRRSNAGASGARQEPGAVPTPGPSPPSGASGSPSPQNKVAAKWARKVGNRRRAKLARQRQPDPWDDLPVAAPSQSGNQTRASEAEKNVVRVPPHEKRASPPLPPSSLATHIAQDAALLKKLGWRKFVEQRRSSSDFALLDNVDHPAQRLLKSYKKRGAPVKMETRAWTRKQVSAALARGAHRSCMEHLEFLHEEFADMIAKSQWVVLPAEAVADLPGLRISPPGVVPQRGRRPRR